MFCFTLSKTVIIVHLKSYPLVPTSWGKTTLLFLLLKGVFYFFGSMYLGKVGMHHQFDSGNFGFCYFSLITTALFSVCNLLGQVELQTISYAAASVSVQIFFLWLTTVSLFHINMVHGLVRHGGRQKLGIPSLTISLLNLPLLFSVFPVSWLHFSGSPARKTAGFPMVASICVPRGCTYFWAKNHGDGIYFSSFLFSSHWHEPPPESTCFCSLSNIFRKLPFG